VTTLEVVKELLGFEHIDQGTILSSSDNFKEEGQHPSGKAVAAKDDFAHFRPILLAINPLKTEGIVQENLEIVHVEAKPVDLGSPSHLSLGSCKERRLKRSAEPLFKFFNR